MSYEGRKPSLNANGRERTVLIILAPARDGRLPIPSSESIKRNEASPFCRELHIENFLGFVQLACLHILLRHFMKLLPGPLRRMRSQSTYSEIIPIVPSQVSTS